MKKMLLAVTTALIVLSCDKDNDQLNASSCARQIKPLFEKELICQQKGVMEVNLYSGVYAGQRVYFAMPMCISCNTLPPSFGYTCEKEKVIFDDFNRKISDIEQVYNSCTQVFSE